jgi:hypothetical protein
MESDVYQHTQVGWLMIGLLATGLLAAGLMFVYGGSEARWAGGIIAGVVLITGVIFSTLTVRINESHVTWWFGPGFWTYSIQTDRIEDVQAVRTAAIEGWGIRYTMKGRLYNVSGLDAVGISLVDGAYIRIGTDEPDALCEAIQDAR